MKEKLQDRYNQILLFFTIFICILVFRLFVLTIVQGEEWEKLSDEIRIKKIPIAAQRGEIRDRYGRILAGSQPSFTVQIIKNELIDEKINEVAIKLLNILIKNGEKFNDNFPIKIEDQQFYYTFDKEIDEWLSQHGMKGLRNAEEAFQFLRNTLGIDPNLDMYEAQLEMQEKHGIYPPISVKNLKFTAEMQKEHFLESYHLSKDLTAEEAFKALREKFKIPENYTNEDARKVLLIRNELQEQGYRQYQPVKIALDVSAKTVAEIEEKGLELPGVNIEVEPTRYYPNQNLASHVLGYLGKISDVDKEKYVNELGYSPNDLIGKDGLERTYEKELKGKDGAKYVEVDAYGRLIRVLEEEKPIKGKDLYLTIDAKLQKVAEDALKQALQQIQVGGTFESKWGNYNYGESFKNATSGTVVALDAKTGEVLALANEPSFDPNLFATGISSKDWRELQDQNPRDPLSPVPLYNIAIRTAVQPGSTYKMVTALAGLESGLPPTYKMYDGGAIRLGGRSFGCWLWNSSKRSHGWVDLYRALEVSCNYYFYNLATGWDHHKNIPLPVSMNVDKLLSYTKMLGLGEPTGIELSESAYGVPDPKAKLGTIKTLLGNHLKTYAKTYFKQNITSNKEQVEKRIEEIVGWAEENPSRKTLIERLQKMDVKEEQVEPLADLVKFTYFNQAKWSKGDTFNLSIGQGSHAYTPIQMANYIATLANGGYKNKVTLVKKLGSEESSEEKTASKDSRIPLKNYENLKHVLKGMRDVTQGAEGTGRSVFSNFPVEVAAKTGTAEKSGKIQPKDEAEYLKAYFRTWQRISPNLTLDAVEQKAEKMMKENKSAYPNKGLAMREAIKELSNGKITNAILDQFKDNYDNFAWFVSFAPYDDPQIVVVSLIFQGGHGGYAAPIAREVIAEYLGLNEDDQNYQKVNLKNTLTD